MNNITRIVSVFGVVCLLINEAYSQSSYTTEQESVLKALRGLSASTAPDGGGADAYGSFLAEDFSRWTIGSDLTNEKANWVEGMREWFDDGWRVSERKQEIIELSIVQDMALTRRIVTETYLGPDGDTSSSRAALSEVWIKREGRWLLFRVNVHPM